MKKFILLFDQLETDYSKNIDSFPSDLWAVQWAALKKKNTVCLTNINQGLTNIFKI